MLITCWGARGSIAVSGREYLQYGGDTTCLEIRTRNNEVVVVDAGTGIRRLGTALLAERVKKISVVFTHAHWDHLLGFPFFKPLYAQGTAMDLYGCPFVQASIREFLKQSMSPPHFPVNLDDLKAELTYHGACSGPFQIDSIQITPIHLSHPNRGIGYGFVEDGKRFVFLTDNELTYVHPGGLEREAYVEFCRGADVLFHDAEFTGEEYFHARGWGHTVFTDALGLALDAGVKQFGLFHHNQERSDEALDRMVEECRSLVEEKHAALRCFAVGSGLRMQI